MERSSDVPAIGEGVLDPAQRSAAPNGVGAMLVIVPMEPSGLIPGNGAACGADNEVSTLAHRYVLGFRASVIAGMRRRAPAATSRVVGV
jgi:hypothetical protein